MISPPKPPYRDRQTSVDDARQDFRIEVLETKIASVESKLDQLTATVTVGFAQARAQGSSETTKLLIGGIVAVITSIAGAVGVNHYQRPPQAPTTIHRSAFDRALDACRELPDASKAGECISRVTVDSVAGTPRN